MRSRAFWLAVLIAIAFALAGASTGGWTRSSTPLAQSLDLSSDRLNEIIILSLVFVCTPIFFRDGIFDVGDLLWSTPVSVGMYVIGKLFAALALGLSLLLGVETIAWVAVQIGSKFPFYASLPLHLIVRLGLLLPTLFFVVSANLFLSVLIGRLRLFILLSSMLWLGWTGFLLPASMTQPRNFVPVGVFYSSILCLGPDKELLVANRLLWTGIALVMLVLAILIYARRERRAYLPAKSMWTLGFIGVAGLGLLIEEWTVLEQASGLLRTDPLPAHFLLLSSSSDGLLRYRTNDESISDANLPSQDWLAVEVLTVEVSVSLTPSTGLIQGEATLTLFYSGEEALGEMPLFLNSGLEVKRVLEFETKREVAFTRTGLELTLYPKPSLRPGTSWIVKVLYEGHYKTPRVAYRDVDICLHKIVEARSYLGQDIVFLMRDGDWYPWPLSLFSQREPTGQLAVQLSPQRQTFHTAHVIEGDKLLWNGRWPALLVASYPPGKLYPLAVTNGYAYLTDPRDAVAREEASDYASAYAGMSHWLEGKKTSIILVQVPLILQPVATVGPSGEEIVFIPEGTAFLNRQRDGWSGARIEGNVEHLCRERAREVVTAWWSARLDFPSPRYVLDCPFGGVNCPTDSGCALQTLPSDLFLDLLSSVSSGAWLRLSGQPVDCATEVALLKALFDQESYILYDSVDVKQRLSQGFVGSLKAEKELARRGAFPVSSIPYRTLATSSNTLDLVEACVKVDDEVLGKILREWLGNQSVGRADLNSLLLLLNR